MERAPRIRTPARIGRTGGNDLRAQLAFRASVGATLARELSPLVTAMETVLGRLKDRFASSAISLAMRRTS